MSEVKEFLKSDYYDLRAAHEYNLFLDELAKKRGSYYNHDMEVKIVEALNASKFYSEIEKIVPETEKYVDALEAMMRYRVAQELLKSYNVKSEVIAETQRIQIIKYTYTNGTWPRYSYEDYYNEHDYNGPFNSDFSFYGQKEFYNKVELITDFDSVKVSYVRKDKVYSGNTDLIKQFIDIYDHMLSEIHANDYACRLNISKSTLEEIFWTGDLDYYTNWHDKFVEYKGKQYRDREVLKLVEEMAVAKTKRYVRNDEFVEYPRGVRYVDFLEKMMNGTSEYKVYEG